MSFKDPLSISQKILISLRYFIAVFILFFVAHTAKATDYYFSSSLGNDSYTSAQAQNQTTPWRSIAKLNSFFSSIVAGDIIYFKRGDVFYGSISVTKSGSSVRPIVIGAYGSGNKPIISGFTTITSWSLLRTGVYQANIPGVSNSLNLVSINGLPQQLGRYPNYDYPSDPYLYYESFTSNSITDNQLTSSTNWTGAEVVVKKVRWVLDRCKITSHSGGTLSYINPTSYIGKANFGYFIQNDSRTLDKFGEWYLNTSTKNLQIHFGNNQPSSYSVKVATVENLINLNNSRFINITGLAFEGGNSNGLSSQDGSNINVQGCDFTQMGRDGISIANTPNVLMENLSVNNIINNGIRVSNSVVNNVVLRNSTIKNCGILPGMGESGSGSYRAVSIAVNSGATIEYNNIDTIGYNALEFQGSNVDIRFNFINNYCIVKDDGGGIYSWANNNSSFVNRSIYNNIVLNAKGDPFGTSGRTAEAKGIYLDGGSINVNIYNNSIAHIARTGLLLNNAQEVKLNGNTVYNARFGVELVRLLSPTLVRNIEMKNNVIYPKEFNQIAFYYKNWYLNSPSTTTIQQDVQSIGTLDSNYYSTPNATGFGINYSLNYTANPNVLNVAPTSLEKWKSYTKKEVSSKRAAKSPASVDIQRFEYNATNAAKTINLGAKYLGVDSTEYNGSITLAPYTSKILVREGPITNPSPPPVTPSGFTATAVAPVISCFGGNATVVITASGGTAPYTGTGSFAVNAGTGSLKISVASPVAGRFTLVYSTIGAVSNLKSYVLRFSTLGTSTNGSLRTAIRQTTSPWSNITAIQSASFGVGRTDHQFIFNRPPITPNASFLIEILQSSGTTYIDNIAFFESNTSGDPITNNLYPSGQMESRNSNLFVWSAANNHLAEYDFTSKISNTYNYLVQDATGAKTIVSAATAQPAGALTVASTAGNITVFGGTTTVVVTATGGTAPYTGAGNFTNVKAGTYNYTVTDAKGCSTITSITISQPAASIVFNAIANTPTINCFGGNTTVAVTASGGTPPYTGTGSFAVNAGTGSLKISVASPIAGRSTLVYSTIGAVSNLKSYVFRFSTFGTIANGSLRAALRQTSSPWANITATQSRSVGIGRQDHQFIFNAPSTTVNASFIIELLQNSSITYIDNVAFFESTSTGDPITNNLFPNGQMESRNSNLFVWSATNNHLAEYDFTSKISNTYNYLIQDANGVKIIVTAATAQPATALRAASTANNIAVLGGTTTVVVTATGGTAPYIGTGSFTNIRAGTYNYTVTDANLCTSITTISVTQAAARTANSATNSSITSGVLLNNTLSAVKDTINIISYPNPTISEFALYVTGGTTEKVDISVFSIDGRIVFKTQGPTNRRYSFGKEFSSGMFIIKVVQGKTLQTLKVVKAK